MKFRFLYILISLLIFESCARRGRPEGGEKDTTAPIFITADPQHESTHFDAEKIRLNFDEYVKLKDINTQLVISPPMKTQPIITPVGTASKMINIKILDTLKENTTYTFNFGNSVEDNNEGIPLKSFKYVFSTGDYIDSLLVKGTVTDGFEKKVDENISIQLYEVTEEYTDSIIYKELPNYVGNTLDSIAFEITNLKEGTYLMIALKDVSNNYKFDYKQDKIAFHPEYITLPTDEIFELTLFQEELPFVSTRPSEVAKGHIYFGYEGDAKDLKINLLSEKPEGYKSTLVFEKDKDTVSYWYTPFAKDSLQFRITNKDYNKDVTVKLRSKKVDSLRVGAETKGVLSLRDTFAITTNIPIEKINRTKISIVDKDSVPVYFTTILDTSKQRLRLDFDKKFNNKYQFRFLPNAIEDLFGNVNDTLNFTVTTKEPEDYGIIRLNLSNVKSFPVILDLLDDKGKITERVYATENRQFKFEHLTPKSYTVRLIYDANNNHKWDSGNFLQRIPPEKVVYFKEKIEISTNWVETKTFSLK